MQHNFAVLERKKIYFEQIYFVNMESRLTGEETIFMQVIPQSDELRFELANYEENKMKKKSEERILRQTSVV